MFRISPDRDYRSRLGPLFQAEGSPAGIWGPRCRVGRGVGGGDGDWGLLATGQRGRSCLTADTRDTDRTGTLECDPNPHYSHPPAGQGFSGSRALSPPCQQLGWGRGLGNPPGRD